MPQVTRCPHCNRELKVPDGAAGKLRCPLCQQIFAVRAAPAREPVAVGVAPAPASKLPNGSSPKTPIVAPAAPRRQAAPPTACPACKAKLSPGASSCMECGYLLHAEVGAGDTEESPNLCPNTACGVANAVGERHCQRCGSPLPMPGGTMLNNRYRIERLLAIGGFAAVYLGTDTKTGSLIAIKDMICPEPQEFDIRLNFFQREAQILKALSSLPIVPRLYDFMQKGQAAQLVMEFINGQDLLKLMETNGNKAFPFEQVVEWAKSLCDVLGHMHGMWPPLVHRDVKPENIMLLDDQRSIKLIDFGTARDVGGSSKTRVASKTRVYTEGYAPPEQIVGKPEARSDLFALAGTLYHLLTGKAPEGFYTARELASQLADPKCPIPADQRWLYELIKINLAEDVHDRYFSCREIKADLERRQMTQEIPCPQCQAHNPVRQPFCCQCAAPLTETMPACSHCAKINRMGSRCCIHCGNRLP